MKAVFFISALIILYAYVLYPAIIYVWGTFFKKRVEKRYELLPVSVVLAVRDEEENIKRRIQNLIEQDYPQDLAEVIVVSDGSRDRTAEIARAVGGERVKVIETPGRLGKSQAINLGVEAASNDIIVFADARQTFSENSFAELTAMFHDERVGAVSGELVLSGESGDEVREGIGLYWEYEKLIRRKESAADSVVGASGSIYAIRKALFTPLPVNTLLDDFLIPMRIVLQGYRVIFIRSAKAYDRISGRATEEFLRKVRTLAGNFQAIRYEKSLLDPRKNRIFFQFISHKLARLVVPYCCIAALISDFFIDGFFFRLTLLLQLIFYGAVFLKFTPVVRGRFGGLVRIAWTFVVLNAAAVAGLWVFLAGKDEAIWKRGLD